MALQYNLIPLKDLARGVDLRSAESNVADGYAEDLQNVITNSAGQLAKRPGYQGYAGYVPIRVLEASHDGFQLNLKLSSSVDLSGRPSSPLLVYGKFDQAESGDFSTTAQLRYYPGFSIDVRDVFTAGTTSPRTKTASDTGFSSTDIVAYILTSTTDADASNSWSVPDAVTMNSSTYAVGITYTPASTERVYIVLLDKSASAGTSYIQDYSGAALVQSGGIVTGTILASSHGLSNFNIIPKVLAKDGSGDYYEVIPDTFTVDSTTGDVTFTMNYGANFDGKVILVAAPVDNYAEASAAPGASATFSFAADTNFPYWAFYRLNDITGDYDLTLPDAVSTDDATAIVTVSITNASLSPETYRLYYDFATIAANSIRVVDTTSTSTTYTGTSITDPQLTIWGLSHDGLYSDDGASVTHIDSYKRDAEARLVSGLGGNLYAARTRSEIGSTYQLPSLSVDLDARIASNVSMAPLFQPTGTSSTVRTRGIITGDDVENGLALVSAVSFVSAGIADFTLSLAGKVGTLTLASQIATSDYLTVSGMAHAVNNGTFKIVSVPTQDASSVTIRAENASCLSADLDESGAQGGANVYTDQFATATSTNYILGDVISSAGLSSDLTLAVKSVSGTAVTVSGVTEVVALSQGVNIFGSRTAYVQPLRDSSSSASVAYLVKGDMVTVTNDDLTRQPRVVHLNPYRDAACSITVASGIATVSVGTGKAVSSVSAAANTFTSVAHGFAANDPVQISTSDTLPTGLRSDVVYFVSYVDANTLKLLGKESGTVIDLSDAGSGTHTLTKVHALTVGQRVTIAQTGDSALDGVATVASVPTRATFTYETTSTGVSATGVVVGRTAEFDESLTFSDALATATTVTVSERWIPIEAPTVAGTLPQTTYTRYFDSTDETLRSVIVGGNMYFTNGADEVMKFDGTSLYQAGLFRWQPQLFCQVDTTTGSLTLDSTSAAGSVDCSTKTKFTLLVAGDAVQFKAGDRIVHSGDGATYTVQSVDSTGGFVYTTTTISSNSASWTIKLVKTYRYYFRLNAYDANNNVIASAVTGSQDCIVELTASGQIHLRLVGLPTWGIYDYDRIELWTYRTIADTQQYRRVSARPITFSAANNYIDVLDDVLDIDLEQRGNRDNTMDALIAGGELGTSWEQPPRAKYLTSVNNRLVLANVKDYQQLDITLRKTATVTTSNLNGFTMLLRKSSSDTSTATNMVDRARYEFVNTGSKTVSGITGSAGVSFTVTTSTAHGRVAGDWVYLYYNATGTSKTITYMGWWQVYSVGSSTTFTVKFAGAVAGAAVTFPDRCAVATAGVDIPVWLGTDGNYNTKFGNTTGSYHFHAALRLANAINASMVAVDRTVTGQSAFVPWVTANAGSEYGEGQIVVRQPKYAATTMEVRLGTIGSNYEVYVNNVKRTSDTEVSATTTLFPSRVVISYENHPEIIDNPAAALQEESDSVVDVNSADGEEITGVVPFFGDSSFSAAQVESTVVVFKTNSIYLLDVKTRQVQKIDSQGLGCTAPYSIAPTRNGIMFANLSGVYRLNRNLTVSYVGKFIERYWRDTVNAGSIGIATGHNYGVGRQYKLSVPVDSDAANSVVLVYDHTREGQDQEFGAWTKFTNHAATGWANLDDDSFFATTDGQIFKVRTANDASDYRDDFSAVAEMVILLKAMDGGLPGIRKVCRNVILHTRMDKTSVTGAQIQSAVDNSTDFVSAGDITITLGNKKIESFRVALPTTRFGFLQIKITDSTKDEEFTLAGVDLLLAALTQMGLKERSELS